MRTATASASSQDELEGKSQIESHVQDTVDVLS